jgi:chemotaxis protein CheX
MARAKSKQRRNKGVAKREPHRAPAKKTKSVAIAAEPQIEVEAQSEAEALPIVTLPETLDSASAAGIRDQLLARRGTPIVVDAGQVRRTGMQAVQVLLAAARTWQADGQSYAVTNSSSEFLDTLALVGLSRDHILVEGMPR